MEELLRLIERNPTLTSAQLSVMLNMEEEEVKNIIADCTAKGIIKGYRAIIDWEKVSDSHVKALIELRVTPKKGRGFDEIAQAVSQMEEVEAVTLISGSYDLLVEIKAKSFQEIAMLVAKRLSPLDDVNGTATHFVLRPYKQAGIIYHEGEDEDERSLNSL
ncbi:MAG: Lrp/AsnC family transcriptional regulator [Oscillospiraceae bacterium]